MISRVNLLSQVALVFLTFQCFGQGSWMQVADYGGGPCSFTTGGVINGKAYVVCENELWEYDPVADVWNTKANFPGSARVGPSSFVIDNIFYFGIGNVLFGPLLDDWWKYDPSNDTWVQLNNFAGEKRYAAVGFAIDSKGYITTGFADGFNYLKDIWEYDPASDSWVQKSNLPDSGRYLAAGFSVLGKGYVVTGYEGIVGDVQDVWEYNPAADSWLQKGNIEGVARRQAAAFSSSTNGYLATGGTSGPDLADAWKYDPVSDTWSALPDLAGDARRSALGFVIDKFIYLGIGFSPSAITYQDFWRLDIGDPTYTVSPVQIPATYQVTINNNPASDMVYLEILSPDNGPITVSIYDVLGKLLLEKNAEVIAGANQMKIEIPYYQNGMCLIAVNSGRNNICVQKLILQ